MPCHSFKLAAVPTDSAHPALSHASNATVAPLVWAQDAPKTGQHTVEDDLRDEALSYFFAPEQQPVTKPTTGGVNNVVNYVETGDGHRYILRIYNNGNKTEKVTQQNTSSSCWCKVQVPHTLPCHCTQHLKTPASSA